jgi:hypothetical protein
MTFENKRKFANKVESPKGFSGFQLVADRDRAGLAIMLTGIIGITDFSDEFIHLKGYGGRISVRGKGLFISIYENHTVEVVGRVEEISFNYGKN